MRFALQCKAESGPTIIAGKVVVVVVAVTAVEGLAEVPVSMAAIITAATTTITVGAAIHAPLLAAVTVLHLGEGGHPREALEGSTAARLDDSTAGHHHPAVVDRHHRR